MSEEKQQQVEKETKEIENAVTEAQALCSRTGEDFSKELLQWAAQFEQRPPATLETALATKIGGD